MKRHLWTLLFWVSGGAFILCSSLSYSHASQINQEFIQTRPFKGSIRRDMASHAAKTAAEIQAINYAVRQLVRLPSFQQTSHVEVHRPDIIGLAAMIYTTRLSATGIQGFPPNVLAVEGVTLTPPSDINKAISTALPCKEKLRLYASAFHLKNKYLAEYDSLTSPVLDSPLGDAISKSKKLRIEKSIRKLAALESYIELLHYFTTTWEQPEHVLQKLKQICLEDDKNPLVQMALAEVLLHFDRPTEAMDAIYNALYMMPSLARAHDIKGAILLRQCLPALAADAFTEAIALSNQSPEYYTHRAAAYLVQEELGKMCEDLRKACVFGDCDGFVWAKESGKCQNTPKTLLPPKKDTCANSPLLNNIILPKKNVFTK